MFRSTNLFKLSGPDLYTVVFRKETRVLFSCYVISREMERASIVVKFKKVNFLELSISQNDFIHRAIRER